MTSDLLPDQQRVTSTALVVHPEEDTLRYISSALELFEPGFKVATATTLAGAEAWVATIQPDLLFVSSDVMQIGDLAQLARRLVLPRHRIILMGGQKGQLPGVAIAEYRPTLSVLLALVGASFGANPIGDRGFVSGPDSVVAS